MTDGSLHITHVATVQLLMSFGALRITFRAPVPETTVKCESEHRIHPVSKCVDHHVPDVLPCYEHAEACIPTNR